MRKSFQVISLLLIAIIAAAAWFLWQPLWWLFLLIGPLILLGVVDMLQKKDNIKRNFPLLGRGRYIMEELRPKIYQYFIESDTNGKPFSRMFRNIVYQRSRKGLDTNPFGTKYDVYSEGYEWMNHSIMALDPHKMEQDPRVKIGGPACTQPYSASIYNISAMSYGSISKNAVSALNGGAKIGGFAQNTGEGGIASYHLEHGGDLIYQIGTGYFGCRSADGSFSTENFKEKAALDSVKMIEIKLSQGAKPGHGGILPGVKVTPEIAQIRGIIPYETVVSPPYHTAFNSPMQLLHFVQELRELANGKPIGFKLCVGHKAEFLSICKAMVQSGIYPDFISVDGGEGGTGAAPLEFSNSVGMPFKEAIAFVYNALEGFNVKRHIKIIASGKIITGFHIFRALALGADLCYAARGMMFALGCIQALECNKNTCPTGVTTHDPYLVKGLVVGDKKEKVANFHRQTVISFIEIMASSNMANLDQINRSHVYRRIVMNMHQRYDQIYPYISTGCLLEEGSVPEDWKFDMSLCDPNNFMIHQPLVKLHL